MTSKYHSIGTPKQQSYIERLARETGYANDDVSATLRWLREEQGIDISTSKLGKQGLDSGRASEFIDFLQGWSEPDADEVDTATADDQPTPDRMIGALGHTVIIDGAAGERAGKADSIVLAGYRKDVPALRLIGADGIETITILSAITSITVES